MKIETNDPEWRIDKVVIRKQCPECQQNLNSGMNFCACCGRQLWDHKAFEIDVETMIRNFPSHIRDFKANMPQIKYPFAPRKQDAFCDGWSCAVDAVKAALTDMQNERIMKGDE